MYYENNIKKAIIKAKRPTASVKANPNMAYLNNLVSSEGFLPNAKTKIQIRYQHRHRTCKSYSCNPAPQLFPIVNKLKYTLFKVEVHRIN